jgi:diphthine synthase
MALYLVGIGLNDERDITQKGIEAIKRCDVIYLENYTSLLQCSVKDLEAFYGKSIVIANREMVESERLLDEAERKEIALLVIGDPFSATTHVELFRSAKERNIPVHVIHNASIVTAVGITGLQLYKFGHVTSIPFFEEYISVSTPYDVLEKNRKMGLHTLFLLDLDPSLERFMTVNDAIEALIKIEMQEKRNVIRDDMLVVGCARLGSDTPLIKAGKLADIRGVDFGTPPHCFIIPGTLHFTEEACLKMYSD